MAAKNENRNTNNFSIIEIEELTFDCFVVQFLLKTLSSGEKDDRSVLLIVAL